jgi:hypothetical protein
VPRLRNTTTGVIVNVSDEQAAILDGYEPAPAKPRSSKSGASTPKKATEPSEK